MGSGTKNFLKWWSLPEGRSWYSATKYIAITPQYFINFYKCKSKLVVVLSADGLPDVHQQQLRETHDPEGASRRQEL